MTVSVLGIHTFPVRSITSFRCASTVCMCELGLTTCSKTRRPNDFFEIQKKKWLMFREIRIRLRFIANGRYIRNQTGLLKKKSRPYLDLLRPLPETRQLAKIAYL